MYDLDRRQGFRGPLARLEKSLETEFKTKYREYLGLEEGEELEFQPHKLYVGVVKGFGGEYGGHGILDIAGKEGLLPLAGMVWAREADPHRN